MTLIVDASVAIKWLIPEAETDRAVALLGSDTLIAPDFLLLECANVLSQKVKTGKIGSAEAVQGLESLSATGVRLVSAHGRIKEAQRLAIELAQTSYHCLYLALALLEGCQMITADQRFARAAGTAYPSAVRLL